jgi:transposase
MKGSRLSSVQLEKLLGFFVAGVTARTAAEMVGINRNSVNLFYNKLRQIIVHFTELESPFLHGEVEVDESYFGGVRKGQRGRGAAGKVPVFGCLERKGKVYTQMIADVKEKTLIPIIRCKIRPDSIIYSDNFKSYNALDVSEFKHLRINHSEKFADEKNHNNGMENFWDQAKRHLRKFNGIPKNKFNLFLKAWEFRFNYRTTKQLLATLKWIKIYYKTQS